MLYWNMNEQEKRAEVESQWDAMFFGVKRTVRYHLHRRRFFKFWKAVTDFLVIASGGTVISLASAQDKKTWIVVAAGAVTALFGTLDLVIGFSDKSRDHRDLLEKFSKLEAEMTKDAVAKERLVEFTNKRLELEVDEPPIKRVLNMFSHNELVIAMDCPQEHLADIKWWQSLAKQFIDICPERIRTFKQIDDARSAKQKQIAASLSAQKPAEIKA